MSYRFASKASDLCPHTMEWRTNSNDTSFCISTRFDATFCATNHLSVMPTIPEPQIFHDSTALGELTLIH
ncbi:hypothetical protein Y032_0058g2872 [Ancylostoma ceylanicum]|uniref:Uncharacterized protein n=1 Tax=Ancylostoma ceylanicum TaxID=53326 RepID=A0A016U4I7_9BILA|nr:hypothetical protein Y032_0058g2872 [Ancylostoma ceylanicum]